MKKLFITGGHFTPAQAVIEEFITEKDWKIYFVGRKHTFEGDSSISLEFSELGNDPNITFLPIITGRWQRRITVQAAKSLLKIPLGFAQSFYWLAKFQPDIILSFGGYLALPVVIVGWMLGVQIATHEQTRTFGQANRIIQYFASKVLTSFKSQEKIAEKWEFVGNPVRKETFKINGSKNFEEIKKTKSKLKLPLVYMTGGNQGSHSLNMIFRENLEAILSESLLIWQVGGNLEHKDFEHIVELVESLPEKLQERVQVTRFVTSSEIGSVFELSDLVISRSGANTVFELAALGKPAILVPLPWSAGNEQEENARELGSFGGAVIIRQEDLKEKFLPEFKKTLEKLPELKAGALKSQELYVPEASRKIKEVVLSLAK